MAGELYVIFNDLVTATLAQQQARVERGELTALSLAILRSRLSKNIQPCFGAMPIDTINYQHLTDFVQRLNNKGLSPTSIQQHIVAARKVFHYAHGMNLIRSLPRFPSVKRSSKCPLEGQLETCCKSVVLHDTSTTTPPFYTLPPRRLHFTVCDPSYSFTVMLRCRLSRHLSTVQLMLVILLKQPVY